MYNNVQCCTVLLLAIRETPDCVGPGLCRGSEWRRAGGGAGRGPQSAVTTDMEINPGRIGMEGRVARRHCGHAGPSREPRKETENRERERDVTAV